MRNGYQPSEVENKRESHPPIGGSSIRVPKEQCHLGCVIEKLELKQGDRLVVKIDALLSDRALERATIEIERWAGDIPVLVLDKSASIAVATPRGSSNL